MMFTKRHEQELAEIKELTDELDQRVREALERIKRIKADGFERPDAKPAAEDRRPQEPSESVPEAIREDIDALAARYELADGAAEALHVLVRLVDWGVPNFVPRSEPSGSKRDKGGVRVPSRLTALSVLADSLAGLELEPLREARRVADIGSGAGFPGLVLAISLPLAHVTLIERIPERCSFLRRAAAELGLDNVEVVEGDMHQWSEGAGACDVVTSRKMGRLDTMVEWSAPLLAPGGAVALWPDTKDFAEDEPPAAAAAAAAVGLRLAQVLPLESANRKGKRVVKHLYMYQKVDAAQPERIEEPQDRLAGRDQQGASSQASSLVAFVHIPKTAGETVTSLLTDAYTRRAVANTGNFLTDPESSEKKVIKRAGAGWESWSRDGGRVAVGHTPYGVFRRVAQPGTRYMTFLREPVDRVLSHYHRHIRRRDPRRAGSSKDVITGRPRADSLEEAIAEKRLAALCNLATRFLCNDPSPSGDLPASAANEAKANLREFAFVGIQERFEESVVLLQRTLGVDLVPAGGYQDQHVSIDRPAVEEIPDEERALIEEYNQLDAELYAFALGLFDDAVRASGEGFAADVDTLRASSAAASAKAGTLPAGT